jgi:hypothetical protein
MRAIEELISCLWHLQKRRVEEYDQREGSQSATFVTSFSSKSSGFAFEYGGGGHEENAEKIDLLIYIINCHTTQRYDVAHKSHLATPLLPHLHPSKKIQKNQLNHCFHCYFQKNFLEYSNHMNVGCSHCRYSHS